MEKENKNGSCTHRLKEGQEACTALLLTFIWPESSHMATLICKASWDLVGKWRPCIVEQNILCSSLESGEQEDGKNKGSMHTCWDKSLLAS